MMRKRDGRGEERRRWEGIWEMIVWDERCVRNGKYGVERGMRRESEVDKSKWFLEDLVWTARVLLLYSQLILIGNNKVTLTRLHTHIKTSQTVRFASSGSLPTLKFTTTI